MDLKAIKPRRRILVPEILYLGNGAHEEQFKNLADQFLLGDPEIINSPFFLKDASGIVSRMEVQN